MDVVRMLLDADEDVADGVFFSNSRDTDGPIPVSCDPDSVADCAIAGACVRACVRADAGGCWEPSGGRRDRWVVFRGGGDRGGGARESFTGLGRADGGGKRDEAQQARRRM